MNNRGAIVLLTLAGCTTSVGRSSTAVTATSPVARLIALYDLDGDGALSEAELEPHIPEGATLATFDEDHNNLLDETEMRAVLWGVNSRGGKARREDGTRGERKSGEGRRRRGRTRDGE
jgi:hypothetical protein